MNKYFFIIIAIYFQDTFFSIREFKYFLFFRTIIFILLGIESVYYFLIYKKKKRKKLYLKFIVIFSFYVIYFMNFFTSKSIVIFLYLCILMILNEEDKEEIYEIFYKIISFLCFTGIISYMLYIYIRPLNYEILPTVKNGWVFIRYLGVLILKNSNNLLYRFQSIFGEPGELGTIIGMIFLFDDNYKKLKKERIILIISGILTFSLAFYAFLSLKFIISEIRIKNKFFIFILFLIFAITINPLIKNIGGGELYYRVYGRIKTLNFNRKNNNAKLVLKEFYKNGNLLIGTRENINKKVNLDISSIEVILYERGFLGLGILILFIFFISNFFYVKNKIKLRILIFLLSIYQRPNLLHTVYLLILITGISYSNKYYKK